MSRLLILGLVVLAGAAIPAGVVAARMPTLSERTAIVRALPAQLRKVPAGCVWLDVELASTPGWASVTPHWLVGTSASDPCVRYAADGWYLLRRKPGHAWRVVFDGSDRPLCSLHVPRDLSTCQR